MRVPEQAIKNTGSWMLMTEVGRDSTKYCHFNKHVGDTSEERFSQLAMGGEVSKGTNTHPNCRRGQTISN